MIIHLQRILFFWTDISGYMAACWRELSRLPGVTVHVMAYGSSQATAFAHATMADIEWTPMNEHERHDPEFLGARIREFDPDAISLSGWINRAYRSLPFRPESRGRRFLMAMDMPWRGTFKQHLAPFLLRRYLARIDTVMVPGERSWQYARRLGFAEPQIRRGLYGVDHTGLSRLLDRRLASGSWPRRFLFAGRYSAEKGIDLLVDAYAEYRRRVAAPWPLACCGKGPLADRLSGQPGVEDLGFIQPAELHEQMVTSGVFLLPSLFDPWPLALVEAASAGLPVIASNACGSAVEVIRDGVTGFTFATGDREALVQALVRVHDAADLPEIGRRARAFAEPYAAEHWARRWVDAARGA